MFKAFTYALVLTSQNSRKIHSHSQKQSNSRCLMGVFYHILVFCVGTKYKDGITYSVGLLRCSFCDYEGNARSLERCGTEQLVKFSTPFLF